MILYYKRQLILLQNATVVSLQNVTKFITKRIRLFTTKCESFITNCKSYYKMRQFYYKMRQLLQIATFIKKCQFLNKNIQHFVKTLFDIFNRFTILSAFKID